MAFVRTRIYYSIFTICGRPNGERRTWAFVVDRRCFSCAQQVKHCRQSDVIRVHCVYCITHIAPPKSSYPCDATTPFNSLYTWIVCNCVCRNRHSLEHHPPNRMHPFHWKQVFKWYPISLLRIHEVNRNMFSIYSHAFTLSQFSREKASMVQTVDTVIEIKNTNLIGKWLRSELCA